MNIKGQFFAFNIWDIGSAKAVINAHSLQSAFLQTSSKVFTSLDKQEFIYSIRRYAKKTKTDVTIHLDHCRDIEIIREAVYYDWDSVMFDGSHLTLEENITLTNMVSDICKPQNVLVEAEVGQVRGVEDDISVIEENTANIKDVVTFINNTKIDLLAVAIGTAHGQYKGIKPNINYGMIAEIGKLTDIPFVIHGGSELTDEVLRKLFSYGNVKKINISTDVKQAYRQGILRALENGLLNENGFDATKVNTAIYESIKEMVVNKLKVLH